MAVQEKLVCSSQLTFPTWPGRSVFYQIFPERFYNGDTNNDPEHIQPWGSKPDIHSFYGGDLQGILCKLPYLKTLGVNALYLNPIFKATTNHKYNTQDYLCIDPSFGDMEVFRKLVDELHKNGMKIILDGVFNHTGIHFWAFQDIIRKGANSKFLDWYYINELPVTINPPNYECWWNISDLPKLNVPNPKVREYLKRVIRFWMKQGIDGWRLDVPNEIEMSFWVEFRQLVKGINPEAYIVGEIWHDATSWLQGDQFDAVMNYRWRDLVIQYLTCHDFSALDFENGLAAIRAPLRWEVTLNMLNVLGSHDTPRILTVFKGKVNLVKMAVLIQMTYPGAPCIYYGDEVGLWGDKDPDCRRTMPWDACCQNLDILHYYQKLINIRQAYRCFQEGGYRPILLEDRQEFFGFLRTGAQESGLVLVNRTNKPLHITIPIEIIRKQLPECRSIINLTDIPHWQIDLRQQARLELNLKPESGSIWLIN